MNATGNPLGIIHGVDIDAYHSGAGISKTGLDEIARSPAIHYALSRAQDRPPRKERAGQLEGALAHCAILEPDEFDRRYAVTPYDAPRRPTATQWGAKKPSPESVAAMDWWREFEARTSGARIITAEQYETAQAQAKSVMQIDEVADLLSDGLPEVSAYWRDPATGVLCRCRPDWVHETPDGVILLDVKTCASAAPDEFARQIWRKRYHVQAAYYSDGYCIAANRPVLAFVFVAVESEYPYAACAMAIDDAWMDAGREAYRRDLETYARCLKDDYWPGYSSGVELLSMSKWMENK